MIQLVAGVVDDDGRCWMESFQVPPGNRMCSFRQLPCLGNRKMFEHGNILTSDLLPCLVLVTPAQSRSSDVAVYPPPVSAQPHSRFFSRILGNPFSHRRSEDSAVPVQFTDHSDGAARKQGLTPPPAPAPKLEYVKLPGTKGSIMIKAVETSRKRQVIPFAQYCVW